MTCFMLSIECSRETNEMRIREESFFIFTAKEDGQEIHFIELASGLKMYLKEPYRVTKDKRYEILLTSNKENIIIREYEEA